MKTLQVVRAKPNPAGKDKDRHGQASAAQLGAEWVDFWNTGRTSIDLGSVQLHHIAYKSDGSTEWKVVMTFTGQLQPGESVRVHSGSGPTSVLSTADQTGATHHLFSGRAYVWNNREGDCPRLFDTSQGQIDRACYDSNPPEGFVLHRVGDKLLPR